MSKEIQLKAFAKINLSIDVLAKRPDGYHEVAMVMQQVNLYDLVTVTISSTALENLIALSSNIPSLPLDEGNLAYRAAKLMRDRFAGNEKKAIRIDLAKQIPVAAGLAGGSANGAAVLLGLNHLWSLGLSLSDLMELGTKLGADVPFCLLGQAAANPKLGFQQEDISTCALAEGIGEVLTPLPGLKGWVVLSKPLIDVSTAKVYGALRVSEVQNRPDTKGLIQGLRKGNAIQVQNSMYNVLQEVSTGLHPIINETILQAQLARPLALGNDIPVKIMMSGSGPTVFALCSNKEPLIPIFNSLKETTPETFLVELL